MNNRITDLEIENFKSIKDIKMDCRRINVFIGRPNVGNSNILEALALFCDPKHGQGNRFLGEYIRYEKLSNLFYDNDRKNQIVVKTNIGFASLKFNMNQNNSYQFLKSGDTSPFNILELFSGKRSDGNNLIEQLRETETGYKQLHPNIGVESTLLSLDDNNPNPNYQVGGFVSTYFSPVKKYEFKPLSEHKDHFPVFLKPPFGENLFTILETNPKLYDEVAHFFKLYNLDLVLDIELERIIVQKQIGNRIYKTPYSLSADTLQRIIFNLAAVKTNTDSILLFEEPENHTFTPYVKLFGEEIVKSQSNQFFIATHSTDLLTPFIEQCPPEELAIFIVDYKNFETTVKQLTDEDLENVMDIGIVNLFENLTNF